MTREAIEKLIALRGEKHFQIEELDAVVEQGVSRVGTFKNPFSNDRPTQDLFENMTGVGVGGCYFKSRADYAKSFYWRYTRPAILAALAERAAAAERAKPTESEIAKAARIRARDRARKRKASTAGAERRKT